MARIREKTLKFPGLNNTYTFADEADLFDANVDCAVGEYRIYDGDLYRCTTPHTGAWDASHFEAAKVGSELPRLNTAIENISELKRKNLSSELVWEVGSIKSSGANTSSTTTIRTNGYIDISNYSSIYFNIDAGYKFGWHFYDESKAHLLSPSAYVTVSTIMAVPSGAKYLRINMQDDEASTATLNWANHLSVYGNYPLFEKVYNCLEVLGSGTDNYIGDKIDLSTSNVVRHCSIVEWKSYTKTEYPGIADYSLNNNQSIAIYNGYVFLFGDGGTVAVADYETKGLLSHFTLELTSKNHQNSAAFSDIFYDSNDDFPLLFIGRCGNSSSGTGNDTCLVYRVQIVNDAFVFTLVNTITSDIETHGNSWAIDFNAKTIAMIGYINGIYSVKTDNPIYMFKWVLPTNADIVSGDTITLNKSDCIATAEIPHKTLQSAFAHSGNIFIGIVDDPSQYVYSMNIEKGIVSSIVPLPSDKEIEGVCVYNGKMYLSSAKSSDSTGTNPLTIYEISF